SQIAGLVAAREHNNPFEHCHIVTTATNKTLRGPRAGIIFSRKESLKEGDSNITIDKAIDFAIFPTLQGSPDVNKIAAIACQMKEVQTQQFKAYIVQMKKNAKILADSLKSRGHKLLTNGTDNHQIIWNLSQHKINGNLFEKLLERVSIYVSKCPIQEDDSIMMKGICMSTSAMTSR